MAEFSLPNRQESKSRTIARGLLIVIGGTIGAAMGPWLASRAEAPIWLIGSASTALLASFGLWLGLAVRFGQTRLSHTASNELASNGALGPDANRNEDLDVFASKPKEIELDPALILARAAIEATPNPVLIINAERRLTAVNQAARERFSIDPSLVSASGQPVRFDALIRRPDLLDAVDTVFATGKAVSLPLETHIPIDRYERASVARFDYRDRLLALITLQDETEARLSERMRADFLANASHELRTPLASIVGFIETLRGPARDDADARDRFLEIMHVQADRMSRLIADLLSLSRIELNEHVAPTGRADLAAAVQEAVDSLPPAIGKRVSIVGDDEPLWAIADWDEVQQVVFNLLDNALKYSGTDRPVTVSLSGYMVRDDAVRWAARQWDNAARLPLTSPALEPKRLYCVVRVEDQGPGIERQHLPRLSERFYRIEETATGRAGTGLGLAIVKHIVSRHRGGLMVESERGRGTAFSVYMPQPADIVAFPKSAPTFSNDDTSVAVTRTS